MKQEVDVFARQLRGEVRDSVHSSSKIKYDRRVASLWNDFDDPDLLRRTAGAIKQHTLEHLGEYLEQAEASFQRNGAKVHWAVDAEQANRTVLEIMRERGARRMVKSKSMVSEETHLVPYLEKNGIEAVETDLGEYIIQIAGDHPSHIVTPIVHLSRKDVAREFERVGLSP